MSSYHFLIAPDFPPERFAGWHLLNTLLQKRTGLHLHLNTPNTHVEEEELIAGGKMAVLYANPFDASKLIREHGYQALVKPINKNNEMVIVSSANGNIHTLDDLKKGTTIAMADNKDVRLIGMRLLEAVDLGENDVKFDITDTYQGSARALIQGKADIAFFIADIYHSLSDITKSQLRLLTESNIATLSHVVLAHTKFSKSAIIKDVLLSLNQDDEGKAVLKELGIPSGFVSVSEEEAEFMIDLMETLLD